METERGKRERERKENETATKHSVVLVAYFVIADVYVKALA